MVETRFDRGVYEDDEDESNEGGGGGSSSTSSDGGGGNIDQELNPFTPDPTDDKNSKDSLSKDTIAPNRPEPSQNKGGGSSSSSNSRGGGGNIDQELNPATPDPTEDNDNNGGGGGGGNIDQELNPETPDPTENNNLSKRQIAPNLANEQDPRKVDLQDARQMQRKLRFSESGETVEEFLDRREKELEAQQEIRVEQNKIRSFDDNTKIVSSTGETVTKDEALDRLENAETQIDQSIDRTVENFNRVSNLLDREETSLTGQLTQTGSSIQELGYETFDAARGKDSDLRGSFTDAARDVRKTGLDIMQEGQEFGEDFARESPNANEFIIGQYADLTGNPIAEDLQEPVGRAEDSFQSGLGTFGTAATGFFTAGAGSLGLLGEQATREPGQTVEDFGEGVVGFGAATASQVSDDPSGFLLEETGEEVAETGIGFLVLGPAGAAIGASPTPTPEPEVNPEAEPEPSTLDRAAAQALPGRDVLIADTDTGSTPDFVNDFDVQTVEPEPVAQPGTGFDTEPEIETEPEAETVIRSKGLDDIIAQPSLEQSELFSDATSTPDAVTQAEAVPDVESFIESRFEARSETRVESRTEPDLFRPELDPRVQTETNPRVETRRTPETDFNSGFDGFLEDFSEEREQLPDEKGQFAASLTASLFNIQAEEGFDEEEFVGTGTEIRPLTEDFL